MYNHDYIHIYRERNYNSKIIKYLFLFSSGDCNRKVVIKENSLIKPDPEPDIVIEAVVYKKDEVRNKLNALLAKFKKPKEESIDIIPTNEHVNISASSSQISQEQASNDQKATYKYENTDVASMSNQVIKSMKRDDKKVNGIKKQEEATPSRLLKTESKEQIFFSIEDLDTNYSDPDELQNQFDNSDYDYGDE